MESSAFYKSLSLVTIILMVILLAISYLPPFKGILAISFVSLAFFIALSIIVFYLGNAAAKSPNKNRLTQLIMILVFVKLFCCLFIIIIYDRLFEPRTNFYVLPFILIYIVFTVFEVNMLSKANRLTQQT